MRITTWSRQERSEFAQKIRQYDAIHLTISESLGRGVRGRRNLRIDEIAPLCQSISSDDPRVAEAYQMYAAPPPKPGSSATVTAIIPCNRGVPLGVRALLEQDIHVEILVLSNGEGPKHVDGARVIQADWDGHGPVRSRALEHVQTEYVFFTVDDALPLGAGCIRTLAEALDSGGWEAAVARQIPWPDADAVTAARLRRWTPPGQRVVPMDQTDHVATLYRTDTLRRFPIPDRPIAEDAWWSKGRRIAYVPTAPVLHSHDREPMALFERNRAIHKELIVMGNPPTVPNLGAALAALPGVIRPALSGGPRELMNQLAEIAGQWRGAVNAR